MRLWSPGARVGHAWLKVDVMKGIVGSVVEVDLGGYGIESGKLGFDVADVGKGGRERSDGVRPGISRVTTF